VTAKAGDIVFDITGDDSKLRQTLGSAANNAMRAGQAIGAAMTAAGAVITGFAVSSVRDYAAVGDEIHKMSKRTGFSTEKLSELSHAAELSGTNLGAVEKASKRLATTVYEAGRGTVTYSEALGEVGLTYEDLAGLKPEDQFMRVAMAIADLGSVSEQSAVAQKVFGRAGADLLPMFEGGRAGMEEMAAEAHRLGIIFSQDGANSAAKYQDTMLGLQMSLRSLKFDIAESLIPTLTELMAKVTEIMVTFRQWRDENEPLVDSIIKMTTVAGGIMVVLGPLLVMLPGIAVAIKGIAAAFVFVAATVGAPVSVVVAAVAALGAAAYGIYKEWDWVKGLLIGVWESIAAAFELIFAPIIYAWEKLQGMVMDAKIQAQQAQSLVGSATQAQSSALVAPGGTSAAMSQAPTGGGGFLGAGNITINVNGAGDPGVVSRMVADALRGELRARGFAT